MDSLVTSRKMGVNSRFTPSFESGVIILDSCVFVLSYMTKAHICNIFLNMAHDEKSQEYLALYIYLLLLMHDTDRLTPETRFFKNIHFWCILRVSYFQSIDLKTENNRNMITSLRILPLPYGNLDQKLKKYHEFAFALNFNIPLAV